MEAMRFFEFIDVDKNQEVTSDEWLEAFDRIDQDGNGAISRKEWTLKNGTTHLFDSIFKVYSVRVTRDEWRQGFLGLDTDNNGKLSVSEWLRNAPTVIQESSVPELAKRPSPELARKPPATLNQAICRPSLSQSDAANQSQSGSSSSTCRLQQDVVAELEKLRADLERARTATQQAQDARAAAEAESRDLKKQVVDAKAALEQERATAQAMSRDLKQQLANAKARVHEVQQELVTAKAHGRELERQSERQAAAQCGAVLKPVLTRAHEDGTLASLLSRAEAAPACAEATRRHARRSS